MFVTRCLRFLPIETKMAQVKEFLWKQKKLIIHHSSLMQFLLLYSPKPRNWAMRYATRFCTILHLAGSQIGY